MKIAIDISPLESGHKVRGTGFYLEHLKNALLEYVPNYDYIFFLGKANIPKNVDVIHFPYFDPFFFMLPLFKKCKTVVTVHDLTPLIFPNHFPAGIKGNVKWQIQKSALKHVDGIIADSQCSQKDIASIVGYPKEKINIVYLAAGEQFKIQNSGVKMQEIKRKYHLPEKFVLYTGDATWNKNLPNLVRAAIQAKLPLVLVGKALVSENIQSNNPWLLDLKKVLSVSQNHKNILRLGFVPTEDLVALYNSATIFAMPSYYEGFGLPILESMACGTPVITSKNGSLPEVAGDAAYYVDADSVESIAEGLCDVFGNITLQKSLREKGLEQAKKFSWKKTAEQTVKAYEAIFNKK